MSYDDQITTAEASAMTGLAERTLRQYRYIDEGPPFVKLGRRVRYRRGDVEAWMANRRTPQERIEAGLVTRRAHEYYSRLRCGYERRPPGHPVA